MISADSKVALILGHPGHELRVFHFLEKYKPRVYILTDGSGQSQESRLYNSLRVIEQAGASIGPVAGKFTDKEIYQIIRELDPIPLFKTIDEITEDMICHNIDAVAGDSIEGFNPTHDLCRYMINCIIRNYEKRVQKTIPNFEFYLDGPPHICPEGLKEESLWLRLSDEEFERKYEACKNYPEIIKDTEALIAKHGKAMFQVECLWPVKNPDIYAAWTTPEPYYEVYGKKKISAGAYQEVITYQSHLLPLAKQMAGYCPAQPR